MRNYNSVFEVRNALTGILCASHTTEVTCLGNAVDTIGFQDMLATLCVATLKGSGATDRGSLLTVKLQDCATVNGTFTDITAGAVNGTAAVQGSARFDVVQLVAGSAVADDPFYQRKLYVILNDGTHKRYIRPHASISGTASSSMECALSVGILLGRPRQASYIVDPVSSTTTDAFVSYGYKWGSTPGM